MAPQTGLEPVTPRLTGTVKKSRKPYVSRDLRIVLTTSDDIKQYRFNCFALKIRLRSQYTIVKTICNILWQPI